MLEVNIDSNRAFGFVERLIQTNENRLACIKAEKLSTNAFHVENALKVIIHQLRICKQKTTKISPFESHFGRKPSTPLSVISTKLKLSNLTYESIVNYYLDEDTVMPDEILPDDKRVKGYLSDIETGMTRAKMSKTERGQARMANLGS